MNTRRADGEQRTVEGSLVSSEDARPMLVGVCDCIVGGNGVPGGLQDFSGVGLCFVGRCIVL